MMIRTLAAALIFLAATEVLAAELSSATRDRLLEVAKRRGLSVDDLYAAASTYTPPGKPDEFVCLNSGGQAGNIIVYGVPSMRLLKYMPTAAAESGVGFNYDEQSRSVMRQGYIDGQEILWGDTHHPAFSETDGKYDGKWAFINDKANPRIFVMDLRDFETKQIVTNPIFRSDHGGAFVTPNSEYIIEASQYASTLDRKYHPLNQDTFNRLWRGGLTYWKFDRDKGRIDESKSFTIIAPPYSQDLSDAGKGESYGYSFTNSFCSERYVGGIELGRPPYEAGCSARDTDYLHVVDWKKAEQLVADGKFEVFNGHKVISLERAAKEGVLFLIPEPKSPHGSDVTPDGRFIVVAGKLDTHASIFDIRKIKDLIARQDFAGKDPYGVPILDMQKSLHGQVELGLGPLHTQYDAREGIGYTSVYIDSVVVKWDYLNLKVLDKTSVHYNIGHLVSMQGDSQDPRGKYVIALNKLAVDRFSPVGPLHPQNHQLLDVTGEKMRVIYDMPLPMGEPHYTVCIDSKGYKAWDAYPQGTDAAMMTTSPLAVARGSEAQSRNGKRVEVKATVGEGGFQPALIDAVQGDEVVVHVHNVETTADRIYKVTIAGLGVLGVIAPGELTTLKFTATGAGRFAIRSQGVHQPFGSRQLAALSVKPDAVAEANRRNRAAEVATRGQIKVPDFLVAEAGSRKVVEGQTEFESYGCGGCHQKGRETGGPDLTGILNRRSADWLKAWIQNPEKFYDDPTVVPLIQKFGVKMPNQNVKPDEAERLVKYLSTW